MNIRANSSGKVLVTFLVIFVVLSLSLAGLAMFFLHQEKNHREQTEAALQKSVDNTHQLETKLQEAIKQGFLLQEKNKEADERINGLMDDLELQKGISDKLKGENQLLKDQISEAAKIKEDLQSQIASNEETVQKFSELQVQYQTAQNALQESEKKAADYKERNQVLEETLAKFQQSSPVVPASDEKSSVPSDQPELQPESPAPQPQPSAEPNNGAVQLEKIIVAPIVMNLDGRILTVDGDNEFVIVNMGANHGIKEGQVLSVSRGKDHLGNIKVTRVQPEMCAADFILPLSSRQVHKDDQVSLQ